MCIPLCTNSDILCGPGKSEIDEKYIDFVTKILSISGREFEELNNILWQMST